LVTGNSSAFSVVFETTAPLPPPKKYYLLLIKYDGLRIIVIHIIGIFYFELRSVIYVIYVYVIFDIIVFIFHHHFSTQYYYNNIVITVIALLVTRVKVHTHTLPSDVGKMPPFHPGTIFCRHHSGATQTIELCRQCVVFALCGNCSRSFSFAHR